MRSPDRIWWSPFAVVDGIDVIHVDLEPDTELEAEAVTWLDRNEKERWRRFKVDRPRRQFALCRAALRANLCDMHGCMNDQLSFETHEHGKPFAIVGGQASANSFNVSHSGSHGLIAFASRGRPQGRIGVDAEVRRAGRDFDGIADLVFGREERAALAAAGGEDEKARLFYRFWTMKEALIKALGTGFSLNPSRFEIPSTMVGGTNSGLFRFPHLPADRWRLEYLGETRFAAALACEVAPDDR